MKGHSTGHALHHSINIVQDALKQKQHVIGIFLDLSKAFDALDHEILLTKLDHCGVNGQAHDLLKSHLTDRDQQTCILRETSDIKRVMYGVPQGSVLGPLLCLLYINDIINCLEDPNDAELVLYADDTNIFVISNDRSSAVTKANNVLYNINNFMKSNLLHICIEKSCYILVYNIPYRRAPRLACRLHRPSASREQRYLAYKLYSLCAKVLQEQKQK